MLVAVINKLCVPFFSNYQNSTSGCILAINKVFSISVRMRAGRFNSCSFPCLLVLMCRQQTRLPSLTLWPSHTHRPVVWKGTQWRSLLLAPIYTWTSLTHTDVQPHFLAIFSPSSIIHTHTDPCTFASRHGQSRLWRRTQAIWCQSVQPTGPVRTGGTGHFFMHCLLSTRLPR